MEILTWSYHKDHKYLKSEKTSKTNDSHFRIHYDDVMYWPSWSPSPSNNLTELLDEAQELFVNI